MPLISVQYKVCLMYLEMCERSFAFALLIRMNAAKFYFLYYKKRYFSWEVVGISHKVADSFMIILKTVFSPDMT